MSPRKRSGEGAPARSSRTAGARGGHHEPGAPVLTYGPSADAIGPIQVTGAIRATRPSECATEPRGRARAQSGQMEHTEDPEIGRLEIKVAQCVAGEDPLFATVALRRVALTLHKLEGRHNRQDGARRRWERVREEAVAQEEEE